MNNSIVESIILLKSREDFKLPFVKGTIFGILSEKYNSVPLSSLVLDKLNGNWGQDEGSLELNVKVLRSHDIRQGYIDFENAAIRSITSKDFEKYRLILGDIVIIKSSGSQDLVGKSQIFIDVPEQEKIIPSNFLMRIRPNKDKVYPKYLDLFLKSPQSFAWRFDTQSTTSGLRNLNTKGYLAVKVPSPPLEVQKEVSNFFDEIYNNDNVEKSDLFDSRLFLRRMKECDFYDESIDLLNERTNLIQKLRQAILQEAVSGKLVPQDPNDESASELLKEISFEKERLIREGKIKREKPLKPIFDGKIPYQIPAGWAWTRLGGICYGITSGSTPSKNQLCSEGDIPYLKVYNIVNNKIDFQSRPQYIDEKIHRTKNRRSILYPGDVIMNIVGPPLGKIAVIPDDYPEWNCNQAIVFFRPFVKKLNNWIYTFLREGSFLNAIELIGTAGQDNISVTKSKNILIPMAPLFEQKRIMQEVNRLMKLCYELEEKIKENQKDSEVLMEAVLNEAFAS